MRRLLAISMAVLLMPLIAEGQRDHMRVSTEWLARNLDSVVIIEIGEAEAYATGHLRQARLIEPAELLRDRDDATNQLPPISELEAIFTRTGAGDRPRIVLYSRDPLLSARAWFTLDYLGHGKRAAILDGGYARWVEEGRPTVQEIPDVEPVAFHARVNGSAVTEIQVMRQLVHHSQLLGASLVMIDTRPPQQFLGSEAGPDIDRPGHIPGAVNVPWNTNLTEGTAPGLLPEKELRRLYSRAGVTSSSTNVVYCRSGMQASMTYFVLRYLGYDVSLYDGSYLEWSRDPTAVIASPPEHSGATPQGPLSGQ
jgi:thiosulfate/3-mercaptopyruvate sulfurtransferase